jgi:hypothetical protein
MVFIIAALSIVDCQCESYFCGGEESRLMDKRLDGDNRLKRSLLSRYIGRMPLNEPHRTYQQWSIDENEERRDYDRAIGSVSPMVNERKSKIVNMEERRRTDTGGHILGKPMHQLHTTTSDFLGDSLTKLQASRRFATNSKGKAEEKGKRAADESCKLLRERQKSHRQSSRHRQPTLCIRFWQGPGSYSHTLKSCQSATRPFSKEPQRRL